MEQKYTGSVYAAYTSHCIEFKFEGKASSLIALWMILGKHIAKDTDTDKDDLALLLKATPDSLLERFYTGGQSTLIKIPGGLGHD